MTLHLPGRVTAQLVNPMGQPLKAADLMVAINVRLHDQYYYGNILGLTGPDGVVGLDRDELDLRFASDASAFPSDYKTPLEECDPVVEIALLSGAEIQKALEAIREYGGVNAEFMRMYEQAKNQWFAPALARVWADLPRTRLLSCFLTSHQLAKAETQDRPHSSE